MNIIRNYFLPKECIVKHQILHILKNKAIEDPRDKIKGTLSFSEIYEVVNKKPNELNKSDLLCVLTVLFNNNELDVSETNSTPIYFPTKKGIESFTDKKYINEGRKYIIEIINDFLKIMGGIILIATFCRSLWYENQNNKKLEIVNQEVKELKKKVDNLNLP